jgi:F0F1-type ATP synthase assembly protein I
MIFVRASNPGLWSAVGAGIGTAAGTAVGNSPVGLAVGAGLGLMFAVLSFRGGRPNKRLK